MRVLAAMLMALFSTGCGLRLQLLDASVRRPSNVWMYFSAHDASGQPVPGLDARHFKVYEDGALISEFEAKQTILNPEVSAIHDTLLLVDMSGSVTASGNVDALAEAAGVFAEHVSRTQNVAVYAFDGRKEIQPIVPFTSGSVQDRLANLNTFKTRDPSTNLNGAVVEGLRVLGKQLDKEKPPLRFGTLVVFTDGSDRAHRVTREDLMQVLDGLGTRMSVFVIGVGAEIDESELHAIGRAGAVLSKNPAELRVAFEKLGERIEGDTHSFYLFSYCSPSRAGEHRVRVRLESEKQGSGSVDYDFNAAGFGPDCDPATRPSFDVKRPKLGR